MLALLPNGGICGIGARHIDGLKNDKPNALGLCLGNFTNSASIPESTTISVMRLGDHGDYSGIIVLNDTVEVDTVAAEYIETFDRLLVCL